MKRILFALLIVVSGATAHAQEHPVILRAVPNLPTHTLIVYGAAFGNKQTVEIAGIAVNVLSASANVLVVALPPVAEQPGEYLLRVTRGNGQTDAWAFTVGAVGPTGDIGIAGTPGIPGETGNQGPQGTRGAPGASARAPDPPCYDNTNRYVVCGNGTITDVTTGLIWLQQTDCLAPTNWTGARQAAFALRDGDCNLTDGSSPGDWRLPTRSEWSRMIGPGLHCTGIDGDGGPGGPPITDDTGTGCHLTDPSSFAGVTNRTDFWGSDNDSGRTQEWDLATRTQFDFGELFYSAKTSVLGVWPVRGGSR